MNKIYIKGPIFSLVVDGNDALKDVIRKKVLVEEFGFWESDSFVNEIDKPYFLKIDPDTYNNKSSLKLALSSTKLGSLSGAIKYLMHYPYGCTEQITSAFMSAVLAKENPAFFKNLAIQSDIDKIINIGVEKLTERQNVDGGWSWWDGQSNVFLSAYVTEYLIRAGKNGANVDKNILSNAEKYFSKEVGKSNIDYSNAAWVKTEEKKKIVRPFTKLCLTDIININF